MKERNECSFEQPGLHEFAICDFLIELLPTQPCSKESLPIKSFASSVAAFGITPLA